ncbi:hypothetical protein FGG30_gp097 [Mycobacterium phage Pixie]|uniref:Uncharacterized protein n=2 Tax=Keshuvirus pixie TaxID=1034114 RepID=G1D506_9CAUD|nr:hypothetical protein FGG30_gp097 [Mycobacterium phage Pixie]AEK09912.1 hypothetical protein PBI_PIXIE_97 [Mycobacterium phage Pixie]AOT23835.1 hypothetical protein SEA_TBOND007_94 [Mycobacterium phage TBond007]
MAWGRFHSWPNPSRSPGGTRSQRPGGARSGLRLARRRDPDSGVTPYAITVAASLRGWSPASKPQAHASEVERSGGGLKRPTN